MGEQKMANNKLLKDYAVTQQLLIPVFDAVHQKNYANISPSDRAQTKQLFILGLTDIGHLFPNLNIKQTSTDPKDYIIKWLKRYYSAKVPSTSTPNPKGSADDPAIAKMVQKNKNYTDSQLEKAIETHNLFMSAENIQGDLLEEYINQHSKFYGWIWAKGESMRACDFIRRDSNGITELMQIKNRDNTENSSSISVRSGTTIKKWNRLTTRKKNKKPYASFNWDELNKAMGIKTSHLMTEEDYMDFLIKVIKNNPSLL